MLAKILRPRTSLGLALVLGLVTLLILVMLVVLVVMPAFTMRTGDKALASASLLDRARLGTWNTPAEADPPIYSYGYEGTDLIGGYQESDFIYANGKYYLFSTGSQEPAWVDVYVGNTPEELVKGPPAFTHVAPIRYPTVVKEGNTWHMWGVNPPHKWTEHWISTHSDPTGFTYSDSPFPNPDGPPMVDFAVRKHPTNGYWYGVGFEPWGDSPLLLARASSPYGPWEKLNYEADTLISGVFGDTGAPPWANSSRPDPNLAFTPDGRTWILFTGKPTTPEPPGVLWRGGIVQVDVDTGKAVGNPVVLFDPDAEQDLPFTGASDMNLISVPGQPDRIYAETDSADYPLAMLDLPDLATFADGRTSTDLVSIDMARGLDVATGMAPTILLTPYRWDPGGLVVSANNGGATSYLAASYLADLTFKVDFTPTSINPSAINEVAHIGGPDYNTGPSISVRIDATNGTPYITARITGSNNSTVLLNSNIIAMPDARYSVVLRRMGSAITLTVNGVVTTETTQGAVLAGLEEWSLATEDTLVQSARYPFQGIIHSFVVVGSDIDD